MPQLNQQNWNTWYDKIYGYFYLRITDTCVVENLTSETVTDFFMYEKNIEHESAFIFGIASNKFKKFLRDKKNKPHLTNVEDHETTSQTSDTMVELRNNIEGFYQHMSDADKEIIELCIMCDFSSQRAAEELKIQPDAVRKRLSRALSRLRKTLKNNNIQLQYA